MTAEAPLVRDPRGQGRVPVLRIGVHVTGKAAATAVLHGIELMLVFLMAEMTAGAELSEQTVRRRPLQRRQSIGAGGWLAENPAGHADHSAPGMHETVGDVLDFIPVAAAANGASVGEVPRERHQRAVGLGRGQGDDAEGQGGGAFVEDVIKQLRGARLLQTEPEFYNTILNSCTTNIVDHVHELVELQEAV